MTQQFDYDVAIVGYGPVGQTLAILMGQMGYSVGVFERWPSLYPLPRAVVYDHEIRRVFRKIGLREELDRISQPSACYQWFNADWDVLVEIDWSAESISGGPAAHLFNQPFLEEILDCKAKAIDTVDVFQGWEATVLSQDNGGCSLSVRSATGDVLSRESKSVRAKYVVGTDGANSFVRQALGVGWQDLGFQEDWLVVDVKPDPDAHLDVPDIGQWCNPERPTTMVPGGPGYRRWEFMRLPNEPVDDLQSTDRAWQLLGPWVTPDNAELVRHAVYQFRSMIAQTWRQGRVMLAGDAAHLMPPFMGQGMCSGMRDVWNLSWRLDLALRGICGDDDIFEDYTRERWPQIKAVIETSIEMGRVVCVSDPDEAKARDEAYLSGEATPPAGFPGVENGLLHKDADGRPIGPAGELSPHGDVEYEDQIQRFDEVVERGFQLIVASEEADEMSVDRSLMQFSDSIDLKVIRLTARSDGSGSLGDVTGKYRDFMRARGLQAILVRPDFYIFGGVHQTEDLPTLIQSLRDKLWTAESGGVDSNEARVAVE